VLRIALPIDAGPVAILRAGGTSVAARAVRTDLACAAGSTTAAAVSRIVTRIDALPVAFDIGGHAARLTLAGFAAGFAAGGRGTNGPATSAIREIALRVDALRAAGQKAFHAHEVALAIHAHRHAVARCGAGRVAAPAMLRILPDDDARGGAMGFAFVARILAGPATAPFTYANLTGIAAVAGQTFPLEGARQPLEACFAQAAFAAEAGGHGGQ
jgi:hypothetical protein